MWTAGWRHPQPAVHIFSFSIGKENMWTAGWGCRQLITVSLPGFSWGRFCIAVSRMKDSSWWTLLFRSSTLWFDFPSIFMRLSSIYSNAFSHSDTSFKMEVPPWSRSPGYPLSSSGRESGPIPLPPLLHKCVSFPDYHNASSEFAR